MSYLDNKGIRFADERLNCAINLTAMSKKGKKLMDFFVSCLSNESVAAIDSKQYVNNIPGKKGFLIESFISDDVDPSFNHTIQAIVFIKNDIVHVFKFNLSSFHDRMYYNSYISEYHKDVFDIVDYDFKGLRSLGDVHKFSFDVVNYNGSFITTIGDKKTYIKKGNVPLLLEDLKQNLKSREYYVNYDREICENYYPEKYRFYQLEINKKIGDIHEKIQRYYDCIYMGVREIDSGGVLEPTTESNLIKREMEELNLDELENQIINFCDWAEENKISAYNVIDYDVWLENKDKVKEIEVKEMEPLPSYKFDVEEKQLTSSIYNPNRCRYYDEDEEEIDYNKKR